MKQLSLYATNESEKQRCLNCKFFKTTCYEINGDLTGKCLSYEESFFYKVKRKIKNFNFYFGTNKKISAKIGEKGLSKIL